MLSDLKGMLVDFLIFWGFISFIILSWFLLLFDRNSKLSYTILKSLAFATLQLHLIDLSLSLFSALRFVVLANLIVSAFVILLSIRNFCKVFGAVMRKIIYLDRAVGRSNLFLFLLVFIFYLYLAVVSYYFPVRGTDDVGYRIPVVFESIKRSGIVIPSHLCDPRFSFPQFPYLIYKLYIIITGGERFLDFTNIYYLLILIISVYYISTFVGSRSDVAFFMSFVLLPVTPIVVGQVTSNYVDLAFASFFMGAVAFCLRILRDNKRTIWDALAGGIFLGGLCGTKYTGLFLLPLLETIIILSKNFRIFVIFNVIATITGGFWYLLNFVNFGFPIYPIPGSPLGKMIYPNPPELFSPPVRHLLAFLLKYDNIDLSYHKGFGLAFWFLVLPLSLKFVISRIKNKTFLLLLILTFVPLSYTFWRIIPSVHVNARFLIWALALSFPSAACEISKNRKLFYFSVLIFFLVFTTNFPKMLQTHHPNLDARVIFREDKCNLKEYDKSFLRYNVWFRHSSEISTFIQFLNANLGEYLKIKCVDEDMKEINCPFFFYGELREGKINEISSCMDEIIDPDLVVVIITYDIHSEKRGYISDFSKEHTFSIPGFQGVYFFTASTVRGEIIDYKIFVREELFDKLRERVDFWKANCAELFRY